MKYLKTYEYVRNTKYSKSLVNDFIKAIESIDKWSYVKDIHNQGNEFGSFWFEVNPKFEKQILKLLPKFVYKASRMGLMLYTNYDGGVEFGGIIKEPKLKRVKPTKYIYHLTPEENVEYILENGIQWGGSSLTKENIIKYIDPNTIRQILQQDMMNSLEPYEYQLEEWLNINHPKWKKEIEDPIEYAQTHDLQDDFQDDYLNNIDVQEYVNDYEAFHLIDYYTIKKAIEKELYPAYMQQWEGAVTEIIENIDKAIQELENINYGTNDSISKMTAAISIALNVMHVGGNISQDKLSYSDNFLDEMSNMDTSEWTKEVTEEFAI